MPARLRDLTITKVALVPKGANPEAHIVLFKHDESDPGSVTVPVSPAAPGVHGTADTVTDPVQKRDISTEDRNRASATSFAGPNRSFPILKPADVAAAARALGRAKGGPAARARIKRRIIAIARRKGPAFMAQLPDAWKVTKTLFTDVRVGYETMVKREECWVHITTYLDHLRAAMGSTLFMGESLKDIGTSIDQFRTAVLNELADL